MSILVMFYFLCLCVCLCMFFILVCIYMICILYHVILKFCIYEIFHNKYKKNDISKTLLFDVANRGSRYSANLLQSAHYNPLQALYFIVCNVRHILLLCLCSTTLLVGIYLYLAGMHFSLGIIS